MRTTAPPSAGRISHPHPCPRRSCVVGSCRSRGALVTLRLRRGIPRLLLSSTVLLLATARGRSWLLGCGQEAPHKPSGGTAQPTKRPVEGSREPSGGCLMQPLALVVIARDGAGSRAQGQASQSNASHKGQRRHGPEFADGVTCIEVSVGREDEVSFRFPREPPYACEVAVSGSWGCHFHTIYPGRSPPPACGLLRPSHAAEFGRGIVFHNRAAFRAITPGHGDSFPPGNGFPPHNRLPLPPNSDSASTSTAGPPARRRARASQVEGGARGHARVSPGAGSGPYLRPAEWSAEGCRVRPDRPACNGRDSRALGEGSDHSDISVGGRGGRGWGGARGIFYPTNHRRRGLDVGTGIRRVSRSVFGRQAIVGRDGRGGAMRAVDPDVGCLGGMAGNPDVSHTISCGVCWRALPRAAVSSDRPRSTKWRGSAWTTSSRNASP